MPSPRPEQQSGAESSSGGQPKVYLDVPMTRLDSSASGGSGPPSASISSANSSATNLHITLDEPHQEQQQQPQQRRVDWAEPAAQDQDTDDDDDDRDEELADEHHLSAQSNTAIASSLAKLDGHHSNKSTQRVSVQSMPESTTPRQASLTPELLEKTLQKRRASGDWSRLSDRFYGPNAAAAAAAASRGTSMDGGRPRAARHPSLRHQVSRPFGFSLPPGAFQGLTSIDLAAATATPRPASFVTTHSRHSHTLSHSQISHTSRRSNSQRQSHYIRPHPLERSLSAASRRSSALLAAPRPASSVANALSRRRKSTRRASEKDQQEAAAQGAEELDDAKDDDDDHHARASWSDAEEEEDEDDATSRDFVTAASMQAGEAEDADNTPGEVWLKSKAKTNAGILTLFKYATGREWALMAVAFVAALAAGALRPVVTVIFGQVANKVTYAQGTPGYVSSLRHAAGEQALIVVYLGVGSLACSFFFMTAFSWIGESITKRLRIRYFRTMLGYDFEFFDRIGTGEMTSRMMGDLALIQEALSEKLPLTFVYLSNFIAGFIVAFVYQWKLACALIVMLPCIFASFVVSKPFIGKHNTRMMDALSDGSNLVDEVLSSLRVGRAFSTEGQMQRLYQGYLYQAQTASLRKRSFQAISVAINYFCVYAGYALAFFYGTLLITRLEATPGDIVTAFFAVLVGSLGLASIAPCIEALGSAGSASARVHRHLAYVPKTKDEGADVGDGLRGTIEFQEVSFAYPLRPSITVLKNFSLTVPSRKTVALVGASGSGKSSAIGLLERFYDNYSGDILLDGVNVKDLRPRSLRSKIGLVTQEPILFNTSIYDNIAFGLLNTDFEHLEISRKRALVEDACKAANAHDFVMTLEYGYDTKLSERGSTLSGGQRQRLALARALVSKPSILLLDEATAALDSTSEEIVQEALNVAASTRTCITVAHRLSTIRNADLIVVMHQGLIVEQGTHEQLMEKQSYYHGLVNSQEIGKEVSPFDDPAGTKRFTHSSLGASTLVNSNDDLVNSFSQSDFKLNQLGTASGDFEMLVDDGPAAAPKAKALPVIKWVLSLGWDCKWALAGGLLSVFVFGLLYPGISVVLGYFMQAYADGYAHGLTAHEINQTGAQYSLYLFIISLLSGILYWSASYFLARFAESLGLSLRKQLFSTMLALPLAWHDLEEHSPNALLGELTQLPLSLMGLTGATLQSILESVVCIVAGVALSIAFGWKLALVAIATIPFTLALGIGRLNTTHKKTVFTEKVLGSSTRFATECLAAIQTVQSLAAEAEVVERFESLIALTSGPILKFSLLNGVIFAASSASLYFVVALTFWFGMYLLASSEYDVKVFYLVFLAVVLGSSHTTTIFLHATSIAKAWSSAKEAYKLCHEPGQVTPDVPSSSHERKPLLPSGSAIHFNRITFKYPTAASNALNQMNATIKQGQFVGIVGPSGSGKSTVISLLERFYEPTDGVITVNGQPMPSLPLTEYRDALALVPQDPGLIQGTIRFNICLGARTNQIVTDDQIYKVLQAANIADFVRDLPNGLDTDLGGRGVALSGGQRQRIAIARALLRDPEILLLDEYTAALDAQSEQIVQKALALASKGRTTIAIAHRIASIQHADVILVLEKGQVVESGSHADLMVRKGKYYELAKGQMLS